MYFLQSPFRNWLFACFFLSILSSCELDGQLATLANVAEQDLMAEDDDLQNQGDSAHLRIGNIIYEENFEGGKAFIQHIHRQLAGGHSFNVSSTQVLDGQKSGRFELRKGDPVVTSSGIRAQVLFQNTLVDQLKNEGWYSFGLYLRRVN